MNSQNKRARGASLSQLQATHIPGVKDVEGIVGKRVVLIDERDSTSSSSALESPSVSNNHPTPHAAPGYADGAGFNAVADAAFNGGNPSGTLEVANPVLMCSSLLNLTVSESSSLDVLHVNLELVDALPDEETGLEVHRQFDFLVRDFQQWPAGTVKFVQSLVNRLAPFRLTDFAAEQNADGTYNESTVEKMYADISRLNWELYATELLLADKSREGIVSEPYPSEAGGPVLKDLVIEDESSEDDEPFTWSVQPDAGTCSLGPTPSPLSAFTFDFGQKGFPPAPIDWLAQIDPKRHSSYPFIRYENPALDKAIDSIVSEPSPSEDNPRIFFADEPRPSIWHILTRDQQRAIEVFAFGGLEAGDSNVIEVPHGNDGLDGAEIVLERVSDSAAGWHDTNPIVRVCIDGNEWNLEFEERSASEGNGNEDDFVGEDNENEDDAARERERREICKQLYLAAGALESGRPPKAQQQLLLSALEWMMLA